MGISGADKGFLSGQKRAGYIVSKLSARGVREHLENGTANTEIYRTLHNQHFIGSSDGGE
jgi:hypothetical protein